MRFAEIHRLTPARLLPLEHARHGVSLPESRESPNTCSRRHSLRRRRLLRCPLYALSFQIVGVSIMAAMCGNGAQSPTKLAVPPAPACPSPVIDNRSWSVITLNDCGIRLRLPKRYRERSWDVIVNDSIGHSYRSGNGDRIDIHVEKPRNPEPSQNKTIRQKDYEGFTECVEVIGGRAAILQSYRGGGIIIRAGRHFPAYHAEGLWQLADGRLLRIRGNALVRESQDEILAMLRTVEFIR